MYKFAGALVESVVALTTPVKRVSYYADWQIFQFFVLLLATLLRIFDQQTVSVVLQF